jgi:hypothetical protein
LQPFFRWTEKSGRLHGNIRPEEIDFFHPNWKKLNEMPHGAILKGKAISIYLKVFNK